MTTLLLEENPSFGWGRRKMSNPAGFDEYGNPIYFGSRRARRRGRRGSRNPIAALGLKQWTQGVSAMDAVAAVGGLAAATMLPGMFIRTAPTTTGGKLGKVLVSLVCAFGAGYLARNLGPRAGQAAIIGGLAGTATQALSAFTTIKIGSGGPVIRRAIGEPITVSPSFTREGETVGVLTP